jgi:HD-like signal output (HDOD) protein
MEWPAAGHDRAPTRGVRPSGRPAANAETPILAAQLRVAVLQGKLTLAPMPELARRALALLQKSEDIDTHRLVEVIAKDPAIVAALLRLANSAAFAGLRVINDLDQAITRLGMRQVGFVVTALVHRGHFTSRNPDRQQLLFGLWDHAVATAMVARRLALKRGGEPAEAFLAGLMHDTGRLLVLRGVEEVEKAARGQTISRKVLDELMDMLHPELGYHALRGWNIAEPICQVALRLQETSPGPADMLLLHVQVADAIARKLGAHPEPEPELQLLDLESVRRLDLSEEVLATLIVSVEDEIAEFRSLI